LTAQLTKNTAAALCLLGAQAVASVSHASPDSSWAYDSKGLGWSDPETGNYITLGLRAQIRYTTIEDEPVVLDDFGDSFESGADIKRARYKVWAGLGDNLTFYHEYDLRNSQLLDLRTTWATNKNFKIRLGQWKPEFNRERVDSSGKQQFSERSIANYWFTIDRQWGLMASGRVAEGSSLDSSWWAGVLGGNGRSENSDGGRPMMLGRWQWNYKGTVLPFSQSALKRYAQPHASLSFAVVANDSQYTRFSSAGGGQLPGYGEGENNQYRIYQAMQEWAWQHKGLSFQQELHGKTIEDQSAGGTRNLLGGYAQMGWFPADRWAVLSPKLEFAGRVALVSPDDEFDSQNREYSLAANWFFKGHRSKMTFDVSYLSIEQDGISGSGSETESDVRFRVQWDVSI
jgi:phosphate-selective porin OprO/OprP